MPSFKQGDIFQAMQTGEFGLSIVFGHIGYNVMAITWRDFMASHPGFACSSDPFREKSNEPRLFQAGCWVQFQPDFEELNKSRGLTDACLAHVLGEALQWAAKNGIKRVITNGVCNVDVDGATPLNEITQKNHESHDRRTTFLTNFVATKERALRIKVTLMSLNDVFIRHRQQ